MKAGQAQALHKPFYNALDSVLNPYIKTSVSLSHKTPKSSEKSSCVRDLAILTSVSESAISHHMRLLKERWIVTQQREGTMIYYSLSDHHLGPLFQEAEYHADHVYRDLPDHPYP